MAVGDDNEFHAAVLAEAEHTVHELQSEYPNVELRVVAAEGNAVPELVHAAQGARLLVVGAHRHRGPLSVGAGYVVDGVLAHSTSPVAVVPTQ